MRPGQKNNRGRGRNNNNNRKPSNPLSRSYDSTGPDVKVRGNAQTVADKYMALARDAQSSGDRVMAENYLQHAEHYNRIVAQGQAQIQERQQRDEAAREQQEREQQEKVAEAAENSDETAEAADSSADNTDAGEATQSADAEEKPRRNQRRRTGPRQRRPRTSENGEDAAAAPKVDVVAEAPVETSDAVEAATPAE